MKIDIKRAVQPGKLVYFKFYRKGLLHYETEFEEEFTVPIEDCGDAVFNAADKAILFMRYMRKWNKGIEDADV